MAHIIWTGVALFAIIELNCTQPNPTHMLVLQIEHKVPDYDGWKKAFDSDPVNRKKSGVKRYQVSRLFDDPGHIIIDLYFNNAEDAQATLAALQNLWNKVEGTVMVKAKTRMLQVVEAIDL